MSWTTFSNFTSVTFDSNSMSVTVNPSSGRSTSYDLTSTLSMYQLEVTDPHTGEPVSTLYVETGESITNSHYNTVETFRSVGTGSGQQAVNLSFGNVDIDNQGTSYFSATLYIGTEDYRNAVWGGQSILLLNQNKVVFTYDDGSGELIVYSNSNQNQYNNPPS